MFNHILVPLDGSKLAESVLPAAKQIAKVFHSSVMLVHVIEKNAPGEVHGDMHLRTPAEAEKYLQEIASETFDDPAKVNHHVHTSEVEDVARSIVEHAGEFQPDLIIMCTHGSGGPRDWLFGSIAQQVIALGTTPVLLISSTATEPHSFPCRKILVALDGQEEHEQGLKKAVELAQTCPAPLHLLMVIPRYRDISGKWTVTSRLLPGTTSRLLDISVEDGEAYLAEHQSHLKEGGITSTVSIARGDPAAIISRTAKEEQVDMIVLGTHGKTGMEAFWEGSVTPKICKHCKMPLLLVPVRGGE